MTLDYKRKLEEVSGGNLYTENMKTPHKRVLMDLNYSITYSYTSLPPTHPPTFLFFFLTFLFFLLYQSLSTNPPVFSSTSILRIHQLWLQESLCHSCAWLPALFTCSVELDVCYFRWYRVKSSFCDASEIPLGVSTGITSTVLNGCDLLAKKFSGSLWYIK